MERFGARHLYTIDGPRDTNVDEIMAFAYEGGVAVVHTFEGVSPLWMLYTEPSVSGDLDELEAAMRLQIEERPHDGDEPLSGMWVMNALKNMIPRMSDETLKQASDLFDQALRDNKDATETRIPVAGMTPNGFLIRDENTIIEDSLACIEGAGVSIARAKRDLDVIMKAVENFHTIAARKLRYQLKLETENADQTIGNL